MDFHLTISSIVLGALAGSFALLSGLLFYQEIGEVNRKLPEDQQISYFWMDLEKYSHIKRQYKRFYPNGKIHFLQFIFQMVGFAFFFLALIASGFFRK